MPHQATDDPVDQARESLRIGRGNVMEAGAVRFVYVHAVQHEHVQVYVDRDTIPRQAGASDQRGFDGAHDNCQHARHRFGASR